MTFTFLDFKIYLIQPEYLCRWSDHLHKFDLLIPTFANLHGIKSLTGLNTLRNGILFDTEKFDTVSNQFPVSRFSTELNTRKMLDRGNGVMLDAEPCIMFESNHKAVPAGPVTCPIPCW